MPKEKMKKIKIHDCNRNFIYYGKPPVDDGIEVRIYGYCGWCEKEGYRVFTECHIEWKETEKLMEGNKSL